MNTATKLEGFLGYMIGYIVITFLSFYERIAPGTNALALVDEN